MSAVPAKKRPAKLAELREYESNHSRHIFVGVNFDLPGRRVPSEPERLRSSSVTVTNLKPAVSAACARSYCGELIETRAAQR